MTNILSGIVLQKKMIMIHTAANKITGLLLFMTPLFIKKRAVFHFS